MRFFAHYSIRYPKRVLLIVTLCMLALAPGISKLQLQVDGEALVPRNHPDVQLDRNIRDSYQLGDTIAIVIRPLNAEHIYSGDTLRSIEMLTAHLLAREELNSPDVTSLATESSHRVFAGTLDFRQLLDPFPNTDEAYDRLRDTIDRIRLYTGTLVAHDASAAAVLVNVPHGSSRTAIHRLVHNIVHDIDWHEHEVDILGAPVGEALLGEHLLRDLGLPATQPYAARRAFGSRLSADSRQPTANSRQPTVGRIGMLPIALTVAFLIFLFSFRSLPAAVLPLMEVGIALSFVFSIMGWLGVPIYLTVVVLPVVLTAVGVADEIHIFDRYQSFLAIRPHSNRAELLQEVMDEMYRPIVRTSVTTALAFFAFALSPLAPVQTFGVFTGIGVLLCMLLSLTAIPAMLALMPASWVAASQANGRNFLRSLFAALTPHIMRRRVAIVIALLLIAGLTPFGIREIDVQDSWIDAFSKSSRFREATDRFEQQFLGGHALLLEVKSENDRIAGEATRPDVLEWGFTLPASITADPAKLVGRSLTFVVKGGTVPEEPELARIVQPIETFITAARVEDGRIVIEAMDAPFAPLLALGVTQGDSITYEIAPQPFMEPNALAHVKSLSAFLVEQHHIGVGGVVGPVEFLETANVMAKGLREDTRQLPSDPNRLSWLWSVHERLRGPQRRKQLVSDDFTSGVVTVFLKDANFRDTAELMESVREYEREHLQPEGLSIEFAGDVARSQAMIGAIVHTQIVSLVASLVAVLLVTSLFGRSLWWGMLCTAPCALAVLTTFAIMGLADVPLGIATSMFAGITLGIGVDFAVHLLERYRRARLCGLDVEQSIADATASTGPAVTIDALAIALGFSVLLFSQVPANARLGGLLAISFGACLLATVLVLPALLRMREPGIR